MWYWAHHSVGLLLLVSTRTNINTSRVSYRGDSISPSDYLVTSCCVPIMYIPDAQGNTFLYWRRQQFYIRLIIYVYVSFLIYLYFFLWNKFFAYFFSNVHTYTEQTPLMDPSRDKSSFQSSINYTNTKVKPPFYLYSRRASLHQTPPKASGERLRHLHPQGARGRSAQARHLVVPRGRAGDWWREAPGDHGGGRPGGQPARDQGVLRWWCWEGWWEFL